MQQLQLGQQLLPVRSPNALATPPRTTRSAQLETRLQSSPSRQPSSPSSEELVRTNNCKRSAVQRRVLLSETDSDCCSLSSGDCVPRSPLTASQTSCSRANTPAQQQRRDCFWSSYKTVEGAMSSPQPCSSPAESAYDTPASTLPSDHSATASPSPVHSARPSQRSLVACRLEDRLAALQLSATGPPPAQRCSVGCISLRASTCSQGTGTGPSAAGDAVSEELVFMRSVAASQRRHQVLLNEDSDASSTRPAEARMRLSFVATSPASPYSSAFPASHPEPAAVSHAGHSTPAALPRSPPAASAIDSVMAGLSALAMHEQPTMQKHPAHLDASPTQSLRSSAAALTAASPKASSSDEAEDEPLLVAPGTAARRCRVTLLRSDSEPGSPTPAHSSAISVPTAQLPARWRHQHSPARFSAEKPAGAQVRFALPASTLSVADLKAAPRRRRTATAVSGPDSGNAADEPAGHQIPSSSSHARGAADARGGTGQPGCPIQLSDSNSDDPLRDCITWVSTKKPARRRPVLASSEGTASEISASDVENSPALVPATAALALDFRTSRKPLRAARPTMFSTPQAKSGPGWSNPELQLTAAGFKRQRQALAEALFKEYSANIFGGKLPSDLQISWNNNLKTTAGLTHYKRENAALPFLPQKYVARVELSSKVVDTHAKLQRTLCHELCHVAAWLLDHTAKPPHGPVFKRWAAAAMAVHPHLDITTCHNYDIHYAFRWQCTNPWCKRTYGRHSNSINTAKKVCGGCHGALQLLGRFNADGTPAKQRAPSQFSLFVKQNFASARKRCPPGTPHAGVMQELSALWKLQKAAVPEA